jgi:2-polyprenyl-6-methoxyphenol hydroxylase-like FAD-dependent oxidoreductase
MPKSQPRESVDLLVVGAGPVGLFAGLSAVRQGLDVLVVDHVSRGYGRGHAALLHAEALALLDDAELVGKLQALGNRVETVTIHVEGEVVAHVELPAPALAVPQSALESVLAAALRNQGVEVRTPVQATSLRQEANHVDVQLTRRELVTLGAPADYSEWEPVESSGIRAGFVIGADGYDSRIRSALGIESVDLGRTESFAMFEFPDAGAPAAEAHLCYASGLSGVVLPLAGQRVRCGFQLADGLDAAPDLARLRGLLSERAPWFPDGTERIDWGSVTHFERRLVRRFGKGRVWLAGDAAHVTSPLGAHSMNVGLLEVHDLVNRIAETSTNGSAASSLERYEHERQREWHKLLGVNVSFELLPHAPAWLAAHARRIVPALPGSGRDLSAMLQRLGLQLS